MRVTPTAKWLTYALLLFVLIASGEREWYPNQYLILLLYAMAFVMWVVLTNLMRRGRPLPRPRARSRLAWIPVLMLLVWLYGVCLGFARNNDVVGITRNFAGMVFYAVFYFIYLSGLTKRALIRVAILAAWLNVGIAVYFLYSYLAAGASDWYGVRTFYSGGLSVLCVYLSLILFKWCSGQPLRRWANRTVLGGPWNGMAGFLIGAYVLVGMSLSKGYIAAFLALAISIPALSFIREITRGKVNVRVVAYFGFCAIASACLLSTVLRPYMLELFLGEKSGNEIREEQAAELIADSTLVGRGLGAVLSSGYRRDELGYGFETTYHNVIHKFGIFAVAIFGAYVITVFAAMRGIVKNSDPFPSVAALGAMMFLIPAYGNPVLFAPVSTVLHCMALYWLRQSNDDIGEYSPTRWALSAGVRSMPASARVASCGSVG